MPHSFPSCFRPLSSSTTLTTSIYSTPLGPAFLSWSSSLLGPLLRLDLLLPSPFHFILRPFLPWRRRGRRRLTLPGTDSDSRGRILLSWDFSSATASLSPSPFSLSLSLDSLPLLVLGDPDSPSPPLISRRDHAAIAGSRPYKTTARFGRRDREISIEFPLGEESNCDPGLRLGIDGDVALEVRRVRWKFRGSEQVDLAGGDRVRVSWDLYNWFFPPGNDSGESAERAVIVVRAEEQGGEEEGYCGKGIGGGVCREERGYLGKSCNWSDSSSVGDEKKKKKGRLSKRSSSPAWSSSSVSSRSSSSVMEWASTEEAKLSSAKGFTLVVCASKC